MNDNRNITHLTSWAYYPSWVELNFNGIIQSWSYGSWLRYKAELENKGVDVLALQKV